MPYYVAREFPSRGALQESQGSKQVGFTRPVWPDDEIELPRCPRDISQRAKPSNLELLDHVGSPVSVHEPGLSRFPSRHHRRVSRGGGSARLAMAFSMSFAATTFAASKFTQCFRRDVDAHAVAVYKG